jgi:hypothetical protein
VPAGASDLAVFRFQAGRRRSSSTRCSGQVGALSRAGIRWPDRRRWTAAIGEVAYCAGAAERTASPGRPTMKRCERFVNRDKLAGQAGLRALPGEGLLSPELYPIASRISCAQGASHFRRLTEPGVSTGN